MKKHLLLLLLLAATYLHVHAQDNVVAQTIYNTSFVIDGIERNCLFYIPLHYNKDEGSYRLLIVLHDTGKTAKNVVSTYSDVLHRQADTAKAIVLYPDAVNKTWNTGPTTNGVNDAGFISIISDYFVQRYNCNAAEIFVAGLGHGGAMARKLGCDLPKKIAGIADFSMAGKPYTCSVPLLPADETQFMQGGKPDNASFERMWQFFINKNAATNAAAFD